MIATKIGAFDSGGEADHIAELTEEILDDLASYNSALFTVGELEWLNYIRCKNRWFTSPEYEQRLFENVWNFREIIRSRVRG